MADKIDELTAAISRIQKEQEELRSLHSAQVETVSQKRKAEESARKVYEEIKAQLDRIKTEVATETRLMSDYHRKGNENKTILERLQRELSREFDKKAINARYQEKLEEFREKCLMSSWRKENREDGKGALQHQIDGAIHLAATGQALLGDKRGLGKTLTAIAYADLRDARKIIVLCPSDCLDNWAREIQLWAPHRRIIKIGGMKKGSRDFMLPMLKMADQFIALLNYESWRRDSHLLDDLVSIQADTLILDEAHRIKEMKSQACKGVMEIRFGTNLCPQCGSVEGPKADRNRSNGHHLNTAKCETCGYSGFITEFCSIQNVLPMTGTAILNRPQELFPQLRIIDPANFKSQGEYMQDFCRTDYQGYWTWQYGAEKKLVEKIGPRYLARDRQAAGVIIPPATPVDHIISMEEMEESYPQQYKAYRQARDYAQLILDPANNVAMSMPHKITVLLRLRQVLVWPAGIKLQVPDPNNPDLLLYDTNLDVHESVKLDTAENLIDDIVAGEERVVLFSQFKDPLHELNERLNNKGIRAAVYDGSTSYDRKQKIQLDFDIKTAPEKPLFDVVLCNYKAAGEGLNFNAATQEVILDKEWNPGRQSQAYGRIDRIGQTRETTIHHIMVEPSVDSWLNRLQEMKRELIEGYESQANELQSAYQALMDGEI